MKRAALLVAGASLLGLPFSAAALDLTAGSGAALGCPASGRGVAVTTGAVAWLQPAPVVTYDNYGGDRYAPAQAGNRGIGVGFAELTGAAYGMCIGAIYRHEYHGRASRDLLDALTGNHHDRLFDPGRSYALSMNFDAFQATGLRLRKVLDFELRGDWSLRVGVGASVLKGLRGQRQSVQGGIVATSGSWATGTGTWLRVHSSLDEGFNPYVQRGNPRGIGYSTDVELLARSRDGWEVGLTVMDLYGRLHWRDLPQAAKYLDNTEISYNANLDQNAAITGMDSIVALKQRIEPKYHLVLVSRSLRGWSAVVSDDAVAGVHFPAMGARYRSDARSADLSYDLRTRAVTVAMGTPAFRVSVTSDDARPGRANVLGLALQTAYAW